ncbi:WD40-repeat-containing domain protein [Dioszegia hungarica]|uniref:WD40-repeat-containing domain protein n=1 Tax=Dioszegia hungarica TaxID=4972 RepID=A0AA38LVZ9_9TREE|nr:WD40-repeat-containing domain protein [Dioszegia hungarica]KAI9637875.1 WD40-repeat-containing domain protein [Dioszegia hungarica]
MPVLSLNFTPNCLTGSRGVLAAGGQHGELHLSDIPSRTSTTRPARAGAGPAAPKVEPFRLDVVLDTRAINNAIVLLPEWPTAWAETSERRRIGYVGGQRRRRDNGETGMVNERSGEEELGATDVDEMGDDEAMDLDEEDEEGEELVQPLSPATYPNTVVPFRQLGRSSFGSATSQLPPARRTTSFSLPQSAAHPIPIARPARQSFSALAPPPATAQSVRIVSSYPGPSRMPNEPRDRRESSASRGSATARERPRVPTRDRPPEPRFLISSNDQSIRMLSLRQIEQAREHPIRSYERESENARLGQAEPTIRTHYRPSAATSALLNNSDWRASHPVLPPPPARAGASSRFGWDNNTAHASLLDAHRTEQLAAQRELRMRQIGDFEAAVGLPPSHGSTTRSGTLPRAPLRVGPQAPWSQVRATAGISRSGGRKAVNVGGSILNFPVNHSSFSPDLKTLVSVGDSTDVQLFEVIDGGREFREIATYHAATDAGFSSAWSKDGRKFAVASQDGQVTVWDHRSSRPLATLFTSPATSSRQSSFTSDIYAEDEGPQGGAWSQDRGAMLYNPLTGEPSSGASTSGREAARVVKFSPEGSSRDLMVFSEENTNIHIVDAKTFNTHVIIPVPSYSPNGRESPPPRVGVDGGECGIAGVAFDPTGEWLYSGTERTVVEWDMRRWGGGEARVSRGGRK